MYNGTQLDDSLTMSTLDASTCDGGISHGTNNNPYNVKDEYICTNPIQEVPKDFTFGENQSTNILQEDILGIHDKPKKYLRGRRTLDDDSLTNRNKKFFKSHNDYVNKRLSSFKDEDELTTLDDILIKEAWQQTESNSWGVASFISGEVNALFPKIKKLEMSIQIDNPVKEGTVYETRTYTYSQ